MHPMKVLFHIPKNPPPVLSGTYSKAFKDFVNVCLQREPAMVRGNDALQRDNQINTNHWFFTSGPLQKSSWSTNLSKAPKKYLIWQSWSKLTNDGRVLTEINPATIQRRSPSKCNYGWSHKKTKKVNGDSAPIADDDDGWDFGTVKQSLPAAPKPSNLAPSPSRYSLGPFGASTQSLVNSDRRASHMSESPSSRKLASSAAVSRYSDTRVSTSRCRCYIIQFFNAKRLRRCIVLNSKLVVFWHWRQCQPEYRAGDWFQVFTTQYRFIQPPPPQ